MKCSMYLLQTDSQKGQSVKCYLKGVTLNMIKNKNIDVFLQNITRQLSFSLFFFKLNIVVKTFPFDFTLGLGLVFVIFFFFCFLEVFLE